MERRRWFTIRGRRGRKVTFGWPRRSSGTMGRQSWGSRLRRSSLRRRWISRLSILIYIDLYTFTIVDIRPDGITSIFIDILGLSLHSGWRSRNDGLPCVSVEMAGFGESERNDYYEN